MRSLRSVLFCIAILLALLGPFNAAAGPQHVSEAPHPAPGDIVVVFPFFNVSQRLADDWLGSRIAETITADLSDVFGLPVLGRESLFEALGSLTLGASVALEEQVAVGLARTLGATWLISGTYQRMEDRIRVTARVIDVRAGGVVQTIRVEGAALGGWLRYTRVDEVWYRLARMLVDRRQESRGGSREAQDRRVDVGSPTPGTREVPSVTRVPAEDIEPRPLPIPAVTDAPAPRPLLTQPGFVRITSATQVATGDPIRRGAEQVYDADFGIHVLRPEFALGTLELDLHLTRRLDLLHVGRAAIALHDLQAKGLTWSVQGGDTQLTPAVSEHGFANLFAPPVTFTGASVSGVGPRTSIRAAAGRVTALRNIFGSDAQMLGETVAVASASHRPTSRITLVARASRVRTSDLLEFSYLVESSRSAGGGIRFQLTPGVQLIADAGIADFRRRGAPEAERRPSVLLGTRWTATRGWLQVNAQHFPAGEFPVLNFSHNDREGLFAAGEYELSTVLRAFGGWSVLRNNLHPDAADLGSVATPRGTTSRAFGGVRVRLVPRSTITLRMEEGKRASHTSPFGTGSASDTGVTAVEWQSAFSRVSTFGRYERRANVQAGSATSTFTQHLGSLRFHFNVSALARLFGSGTVTHRSDLNRDEQRLWELSGGGQFKIPGRDLYVRLQGTTSRNLHQAGALWIPREALNIGLSGMVTDRTSIGVDFFVDRSPVPLIDANPWMTRTIIRVTHTLPMGSARVVGHAGGPRTRRRGTGTVGGLAYVDWNANGSRDPEEDPLSGIGIKLGEEGALITGDDGRFSFAKVPTGPQTVSLDLATLPATFDLPKETPTRVEVRRNATADVAFGVIPLGTIQGEVLRDVNGNGRADEGDEPVDDAVLILDDGARSELVRNGRFRFDAVPPGSHLLELLLDTLPQGAMISGESTVRVEWGREQPIAETVFLISLEQRPEIRRVFPPRQ